MYDRTEGGQQLKSLPVMDEYTRTSLALEVDLSVAKVVREWMEASGVDTLFIEPGSPWENGHIDSFNSRFRDEFLNMELFSSVREAQALAERHRVHYNRDRPHSSLGYLSPAEPTHVISAWDRLIWRASCAGPSLTAWISTARAA